MAELRLNIGPDRVTVDDAIAMEEGAVEGLRDMRNFLARFVVDENEQRVSAEEGQATVGALTLSQLKAAMDAVMGTFEEVKSDAVDPPSSVP